MLRVTVRGAGVPTVVLGTGDTLLFGRAPHGTGPQPDGTAPQPDGTAPQPDPAAALRTTALELPGCAPHVSRLVGELVVGEEVVRLRWRGASSAQLSSLFDAPGGARRVALTVGMAALLDEGENHVLLLRGRADHTDLILVIEVAPVTAEPATAPAPATVDQDASPTAPAPALEPRGREWFVALALAEPWLSGADDYPRPPSNREIYERVRGWHGYAWNLDRSQRVDDAIRVIARLAFGPHDDPFAAPVGRVQNVRFAVGRRAAEVRLVTAEQLESVEREATRRRTPSP